MEHMQDIFESAVRERPLRPAFSSSIMDSDPVMPGVGFGFGRGANDVFTAT